MGTTYPLREFTSLISLKAHPNKAYLFQNAADSCQGKCISKTEERDFLIYAVRGGPQILQHKAQSQPTIKQNGSE